MSLVIPLFATPINIFKLDISTKQQDKIEHILQNIDYGPTNQGGGAGISKDLFLFKNKNLKFLQKKILDCICTYNENVFQYKKTKFEVTTSWATICNNQEESERHKHCNSMYSAVYYNKCSSPPLIFYFIITIGLVIILILKLNNIIILILASGLSNLKIKC